MKKESVNAAENSFLRTGIIKQKLARFIVAWFSDTKSVKVKAVRKLHERQDVYNMTVEKNHNYSVCGGAIIKNCDALRYACEDLSRFGMQV